MRSIPGIFLHTIIVFILILTLSCCRKNAPQRERNKHQSQPRITQLISPVPNTVIHCGEPVKFELSTTDPELTIDSVSVTAGTKPAIVIRDNPASFTWQSSDSRVGQVTLGIRVYFADSLQESHNVNIVILSDIIPEQHTYRVIKKYPHDDQAYTQGLVYDNGVLYESTGLEGKSSLRMVDIETGKPQKMTSLASKYFGEGIALFNDQVYQITYKTQVGFVYDKQSLTQLRSFDYQIPEGWGLTTDGKNLIMSDGSAKLFFIEPEYFTQVDRIEVFNNKGMVDSLNEIEYVNGKVLANVYGQTYIVIIDPATGKITGTVDLDDLMPEGSKGDYGKVLNGIAYNPTTRHFYITGKNWPVLYEIELVPNP